MAASAPEVILESRGLGKEVPSPEGTLTILDGVSLSITRGEAVAVVGVSGSGKSTLLGLLAGLDTPTRGSVRLAGREISGLDEDDRAAVRLGRVAFVFQQFHLIPSLTALENVMLPLELEGARRGGDTAAAARAVLEQVGLAERFGHYPGQLSGGEQQRVAIARAFVTDPVLLFADEPTGNLDEATGEKVSRALFELNETRGTTLLLVTHDRRLAARCARTVELSGGRVVNGGAPAP